MTDPIVCPGCHEDAPDLVMFDAVLRLHICSVCCRQWADPVPHVDSWCAECRSSDNVRRDGDRWRCDRCARSWHVREERPTEWARSVEAEAYRLSRYLTSAIFR